MKACAKHWEELRGAIADRGLSKFVAQSGEAAAARMARQSGSEREDFDPLMGAYMAIVGNVLRIVGIGLLADLPDGKEACPLCTLIDNCGCGRGDECPFRSFVSRAADDQREHARHLGLLPPPA
jgi:hypothetical protein